ncbi:hypothetical protein BDN71DRAFT_1593183 [Pleurotus eryngii]|uniref:Uncharacterized protein n=1 Tax=Pleurotus eryngii TaxID=5323 RepID=A0A9P5ZQ82_PLEER|nr:hypothetical protein BDN71DRAFT_1593183 [Pleurotus eryngii]
MALHQTQTSSDTVEVNVWIDCVDKLSHTFTMEVPIDTTPRKMPQLIRDEQLQVWVGCNTFQLYKPSRPIPIPDEDLYNFRREMMCNLPEHFRLKRLPKSWDLAEECSDPNIIHIFAVETDPRHINIYQTRSDSIVQKTRAIETEIVVYCPESLVPPRGLRLDTIDRRAKTLETLRALTHESDGRIPELAEVEGGQSLLHLHPIWDSRVVHLIDISREEHPLFSMSSMPKLFSAEIDVREQHNTLSPLKPGVGGLNDVATLRRDLFTQNPTKAPSSEAASKTAPQKQVNQQLTGRLNQPELIPPSLYDETLCKLRYDTRYLEPSQEDYRSYYQLREAMIKAYPSESERTRAFNDAAASFLPGRPVGVSINETHPNDGALFVLFRGLNLVYTIIEVKNEMGQAGAEPSIKNGRYYLEHLRAILGAKFEKFNHCAFPVIFIVVIGPYIFVLAGTAAGLKAEPIVEQIACVALHTDLTNQAGILEGARMVGALRAASLGLRDKYPTLMDAHDTQVQFPYPRRYTDLESGLETITTSAPSLLSGFEQVGDWNMIVMDDVTESHLTLRDLASDPSSSTDYNISTNLRGAIDSLHARGFVHGDIRDVNVLVCRMDQMDLASVRDHPDDDDVSMESDKQADILLVDFDWAGREGDVRYPHNVNPDITRSPGAVSGAVILASHDIWMYEHLVSSMVGLGALIA